MSTSRVCAFLMLLGAGCSRTPLAVIDFGDGEPGGADLAGFDLAGVASDFALGPADLAQGADAFASVDLAAPPPDLTSVDLLPPPCPLPAMGEWHVSSWGNDTLSLYSGNGSAACPVKTIARAVTLAKQDGFSATIHLHGGTYDGADLSPLPGQSITLQGDGIADVVVVNTLWMDAPSTASVTISDLHVNGVVLAKGAVTLTVARTLVDCPATGIWGVNYRATGAATLGPGLTVRSCYLAVLADPAAQAALVGTAADPTLIAGSQDTCVVSISSVSGNITLMSCGVRAIADGKDVSDVVVVGGGDSSSPAVTATGTVSNVQITSFVGDGIACQGCSITGDVQVTGAVYASGVRVTSGNASIDGLVSTGNYGDGLRCEGTASLKLRNSILSGNVGNGLLASGSCALDLGTSVDPGGNEFNRTSAKNGRSGLCLLQASGTTVGASASTFSCDYAGAGCMPGSPTTATSSTCQAADITLGSGVALTATGSTCCN